MSSRHPPHWVEACEGAGGSPVPGQEAGVRCGGAAMGQRLAGAAQLWRRLFCREQVQLSAILY